MSQILLVGKPNSGKTLLFNRLTGLQQKVSNFPGVTVEIKSAPWRNHQLVDFPGTYSVNALTQDEAIAVEKFRRFIVEDDTKLVLCVLDAVQLERSLVFGLQVLDIAQSAGKPVVFLLNMIDEIQRNNLTVDAEGLSQALGAPVLAISARTQFGLSELNKNLETYFKFAKREKVSSSASELAGRFGVKTDVFIRKINRWDGFFLSSFWGGLIFLIVMFLIFQSIFTWAAPLMDGAEAIILGIGSWVSDFIPEGSFKDFVNDAVFGGLGSFVVFVPQIFVLMFIIGLLEDSGYLARVAIICHRPLKFFGLSGKSFIPFLSGHACAIPAIYATRMIDSPRKRLVTLLAIPLITCSARLPIYSLFVAALIPDKTVAGGLVGLQGAVFFALFIAGYVLALLVSALYSKYIYRSKSDAPFILELPSYRLPLLKPLILKSLNSCWRFLRDAGPIIFVTTVIVWVLGYFPGGSGHLDSSWMATLGHWIEPFVAPLGLDWRYGVAVLTSFLAREVFVGTLGTLYGIDGAEENVVSLADQLNADGLSMASGIALLVFYVVALQCVSTLAVIGRETSSKRIPVLVFLFYTALAYILALIAYNIFI